MKSVKVGLVGFGTIGTGVARLLLEHRDRICARTGCDVTLKKIVDLDITTPRTVTVPDGVLSTDINTVLNDPEIEIVVQLIGGTGVEREIMLKMLAAGKKIVTANKALLATYGPEIFSTARAHNTTVAFEAAVAGGIPIIAGIAQSLAANEIISIQGILNGTSNFILSSMEENGSDYAPTLAEAQKLGYAEANPAMDIDGSDAAQKLAILAHIAFGAQINWRDILRTGIDTVQKHDFLYAKMLGYSIKLIAAAQRTGDSLLLSVTPTLIRQGTPMADVRGAFNAVSVVGDAVERVFFHGKGAGEMPTASAVLADVIDTIIGRTDLTFRTLNLWNPDKKSDIKLANSGEISGRYYLRLSVADRAGVMSEIAGVLGTHGISIASLVQHESDGADGEKCVPLIIVTHDTTEGAIYKALQELNILPCVMGNAVHMKIQG